MGRALLLFPFWFWGFLVVNESLSALVETWGLLLYVAAAVAAPIVEFVPMRAHADPNYREVFG